ncbi:NAD(P)H-dependent oxidoreductase [Gordonia sp. zg691]|uniref:NAD(P)H-dependent oxidoreductase n=1 Tax=Gordonia jinghuaiqii TaxID=2758710 RepID=A0A7D7QPH9_9ACTN|nr:NAD(P)H-dependent oxidoreductase [Gordonia jinghuaiqii]MBD0860664.1 NAD(P)H-dependent oxidoreductase [Gordonia jinghuaiqii]MCR5978070.1 NADPH-dependent oxidoreductase [Gordonia jinghuaiqii]QMT01466.1 NAD(P)H-dependent oxidoreductase [Gordonia jinghuaiqii]
MIVSVVAGNPKPASRTLSAACLLATNLTGKKPDHVVDVVDLGAGLLGWGDAGVSAAVEIVGNSDLVVFASPTFKATYTGLLKLFLDQFSTSDGLQDVTAIPLMLGAGPAHYMAPDLLLKPVLVELGATVPAAGLYVVDKLHDDSEAFQPWIDRWGRIVLASANVPVTAGDR